MDGDLAAAVPAAAQQPAPVAQIDDWEALLHHHKAKVRALEPAAETAEASAKAARKEVNNAIEIGATELGVTNELFKRWLKQSTMDIKDISHERELETKALKAMGKLVQPDLFAKTPDTADMQAIWHLRGYDDGVNGNRQRDDIDPIHLQTYLQGFTAGQAVLSLGLFRGKELSEAKGQPQTGDAVDLDEEDDEDGDEEARLDDAADKLRRDSEFMARGGGDADDDQPAPPAAKKGRKDQVH
jgi:hypothetical protein